MNLKYAHISKYTIAKPFCSVSKMPGAFASQQLDRNNNVILLCVCFLCVYICLCIIVGCMLYLIVQTRIKAHNEYEIWNDSMWFVNSYINWLATNTHPDTHRHKHRHTNDNDTMAYSVNNWTLAMTKTHRMPYTHTHTHRQHFIIICLFRKHLIVDVLRVYHYGNIVPNKDCYYLYIQINFWNFGRNAEVVSCDARKPAKQPHNKHSNCSHHKHIFR